MPFTSTHPSWCDNPHPPDDNAHVHTATIGSTRLSRGIAVDVALIQARDARGPALALRVTAPGSDVSVDITGAQAWALAGILIDATVAHARATPQSSSSPESGPGRLGRRERNGWLFDRPICRRPRRPPWTGSQCMPAPPDGDDVTG